MPHLKVNRKLEPFLTIPKPIKVAIGGRGSGKSIGFGDIFTMKMETEGADIYCLREFQDSVTDSVHRVFKDSIQKRLCLPGWQVLENKVIAPNGARTNYKGANRNPDAMQSAQGYKYSWFEEAHRATKASLDKLLPTIIRNPGAECWFSANPQSESDPFSQRFIVPYLTDLERDGYYEDDIHLIVVVNWRDNPWWNEEQEKLRRWDYENRPRAEYDWIWEGRFYEGGENAIIEPEWFDAAVDAHKKLGFEPAGLKVLGFDPADEGQDAKAYALRHGVVITDLDQWHEGDMDEATGRVFEVAYQNRVDDLVYDVVGIGAGVKLAVKQRQGRDKFQITPFAGGDVVRDPNALYEDERTNKDMFRNLRSQMIWLVRDRFYKTYQAVEKGKYINPEELISISSDIKYLSSLKSEACKIRRKRGAAVYRVQIESKDEAKARGDKSPNLFEALYMSFANPPQEDDWGGELEYQNVAIV